MILKHWFISIAISSVLIVSALLTLDKLAPLNLSKLTDNATVVTDSSGRPLRAFANPQGIWRYRVTAKNVSPYYLQALFNYEDRHFYQHPGVNPFAMIRAVGQAAYYGKAISGGSTITMQVARLLHPNRRTVSGKIYQMLRAFQLEWHFSKHEILDMYLNIAPYGGPIEGVQTASYVYFDKPAIELNRNEAALLAVLPQSPSRYRPDRYPERAKKARNKLLSRLATFGVWSTQTVATLKQDPIYADYFPHPNTAPLLSRRLMQAQHKARKNRTHKGSSRQVLANRDIQTFIDGDIQEQLEHRLRNYTNNLAPQTSAAIMVMHSKTGEVKAYLGSADFSNNERAGHVDMIKAIRSPGSTLKPFVYGDAIEQGIIHEQSLLHDSPVIKGNYRPTNFSGGYSGPVSTSQALLRSLNLPVLQVLNYGSADALSARLNNAGLSLHWPKYATPNKALVLGGVGTKLEDLVSAYSALINDGQAVTPRYHVNSPQQSHFLLEPASAWIIQNILRQQKQPGRISEQLSPHSNSNIGWKTGTSYGHRDAWVIGFSGPYIIGIWVGRADAITLSNNTGSTSALPLFMQVATHFNQRFIPLKPSTVSQHDICWPNGLRKSQTTDDNCLITKSAWLYQALTPATLGAISPELSNKLTLDYFAEPDGTRANVLCASVQAKPTNMALWPPALASWIPKKWRNSARLPLMSVLCKPQSIALSPLQITSIKPQASFIRRDKKTLYLSLKANQPASELSWFLNGRLLDSSHELIIKRSGSYQLLALDNNGRIDQLSFSVQ
jgi:penicillin-binding protein 1C